MLFASFFIFKNYENVNNLILKQKKQKDKNIIVIAKLEDLIKKLQDNVYNLDSKVDNLESKFDKFESSLNLNNEELKIINDTLREEKYKKDLLSIKIDEIDNKLANFLINN